MPSNSEKLKNLQAEQKKRAGKITSAYENIASSDAAISNYRRGSQDMQTSHDLLKRRLGGITSINNFSTFKMKKKALLAAIKERNRIMQYQSNPEILGHRNESADKLIDYLLKQNNSPSSSSAADNSPKITGILSLARLREKQKGLEAEMAPNQALTQEKRLSLRKKYHKVSTHLLTQAIGLLNPDNPADAGMLKAFADAEIDFQNTLRKELAAGYYRNEYV